MRLTSRPSLADLICSRYNTKADTNFYVALADVSDAQSTPSCHFLLGIFTQSSGNMSMHTKFHSLPMKCCNP